MRWPLLLLCALVAGCGSSTSWVPAGNLAEFEERLETLRQDLRIPGMSAAIAKNQEIVWSRGFGLANVAAQTPATDSTPFHLASLTKTFASTILMELVQSGRLDLDAPISNFGINISSPGTIRVRHLFSHTSGGTPGTTFAYNGDRFALLGDIMQSVTDSSFAVLLQQRIIVPLALHHTSPSTSPQPDLAKGYSPDGSQPVAYPTIFGAAAGLTASARDMAEYSMALDRHQFISEATQDLAWTPYALSGGGTAPYGYGWFVSEIDGHKLVWHYGFWTANSSLIIKAPDLGLTFVLLANTDMLSRPNNLGSGDLMSSPAAREFVNAFVSGTASLP